MKEHQEWQDSQHERVLCAAIHLPNANKCFEENGENPPYQPINISSGIVLCGFRHGCILHQVYGLLPAKEGKEALCNQRVEGFLTSKNRFLNRQEAYDLVRQNKQEVFEDFPQTVPMLYSENLY